MEWQTRKFLTDDNANTSNWNGTAWNGRRGPLVVAFITIVIFIVAIVGNLVYYF